MNYSATHEGRASVGGWPGGFGDAALIDGEVDDRRSWFHSRDQRRRKQPGRTRASDQNRADDQIGLTYFLLQGRAVRHHRGRMSSQQVAQIPQPRRIDIQNGHLSSDACRHPAGIEPGYAASHYHHLSRTHAGGSAQQNAAASTARLQTPRARLDSEPPGDFAHGREQWKAAVFELDGLVAKRAHVPLHEFTRESLVGCQVEVGKENFPGLEVAKLRALRLLDLEHHIRTLPELARRAHDEGTRRAILAVGKSAAHPGAALDDHSMAVSTESSSAGRGQRYASFVGLDFSGNSDKHPNFSAA